VEGSTPWNSEGSTGSGDERGRTGVRGVPDWRRLDLLGRPEVKRPIVWSARGMELLPEKGAADWRDIRVKHDRNRCESVNSVKDGIRRNGSEG